MVTEAFGVWLGAVLVARLYARGDYTWLEWQEGYWDDPRRPILGLWFEDRPQERIASALELPAWFSNLLPEGRLREWVARDAGVSEQREMRLLIRLGYGLPGAVRIEPLVGEVDPTWRPDDVSPPVVRRTSAGLRFSLAGVALKFSMLRDGDRLTLPGGDADGDWIVKMPDAVYPEVPHNEYAMMRLASQCGIEVPEIRLWHRDELPRSLPDAAWPNHQEWAYGIRRFDREQGERIHIEDLAQVRGFKPADKYHGSFETVANLIYRGRDEESLREFIRRLFFSYAIGNGDMHLKNTSLIYRDPRRPAISPAYDLVCTAPYRLPEPEDMGLKLGRSRRFEDVTGQSLVLLAQRVEATADVAREAIADVVSGLAAHSSEALDALERLPGHRAWLDCRLAGVIDRFG